MSIRWGRDASNVSSLAAAKKNGFDWFNLPLSRVMAMTDEQFMRFKVKAGKHGYSFDVCTLELPEDVVITQKGFNVYVWMEYLKKAVIRLSELDCRALSWSDGAARILPEEGDVMGAKEQVAQFLFMLCELSGQYGISILVEPLSREHANFLNTIEETESFLKRISMDNIGISISITETAGASFDFDDLRRYADSIHMVRLDGLAENADRSSGSQFLESLKQSGYSAAFLLPDETDDTDLKFYKDMWESVS